MSSFACTTEREHRWRFDESPEIAALQKSVAITSKGLEGLFVKIPLECVHVRQHDEEALEFTGTILFELT